MFPIFQIPEIKFQIWINVIVYLKVSNFFYPEIQLNDTYTHGCTSLTNLLTMICLIDRILNGARMKSHASLLGTFFVYTLALCMLIFKKKYSLKRLRTSYKKNFLFYVVKFGTFSKTFHGIFFSWKLAYIVPWCIQKHPQQRSMCDFISVPSRTSSIKEVIVVLYL